MGRWRDACVLIRKENDAIKPRQLEELLIDQNSEIVGKDRKGTYRVVEYEQNRPIIVKVQIDYTKLTNAEKKFNRGWVNLETNSKINDFIGFNSRTYSTFKKEVAEAFSCFPYALDFFEYIRGPEIYTEEPKSLILTVPVTPIYITEKDYHYEPAGVKFIRF